MEVQEKLNRVLLEDEKVLWTGTAAKINLMEPPYDKENVRKWILSAFCLITIPTAYLLYEIAKGGTPKISLMIIAILVPILIGMSNYLEVRKLEKDYIYVITNYRAFSLGADANIVCDLELSKVEEVRVEELSTGASVLYLGKYDQDMKKNARSKAIYGVKDEKGNIEGVVFYSVEQPEEIYHHLPEQVKVVFD